MSERKTDAEKIEQERKCREKKRRKTTRDEVNQSVIYISLHLWKKVYF